MKKAFRHSSISYFTDVASKHKLLKGARKRYASVVFVAAFSISSCIFFYKHFEGHFVLVSAQGSDKVAAEVFNITLVEPENVTAEREELSDGESLESLLSLVPDNADAKSGDIALAQLESITVEQDELSDREALESLLSLTPDHADVDVSDAAFSELEPVMAEQEGLTDGKTLVAEHEEEDMETYTLDDLLENHEHKAEREESDHVEGGIVLYGEEPAFDSSDWRLVLINKQHPIPEEYDFKLGTFSSGMRCDERVIEDLLLMMQEAKKDGLNLVVRSPYRSSDHQEDNFNSRIRSYMRQGLSYMEAYKETSRVITIPGCSEHEVGLALDITSDTFIPLLQGFADTEEGRWLDEHCHEYGFILRYPSGKEYITGIEYEPWHFRYVGNEAARIIKEEELCLEEFWDKYL